MDERDHLRDALQEVVGAGHVLDDPSLTAQYETDWTGRFGARALLVVRPASVTEVAAVVAACAAAGVPLIPQGGNTGLVGGGVPSADGREVVVSLTRLNAIGPVDSALGLVPVGAGVTLAALQEAARAAGFDAGLDFAARDSCTIGGAVACNAGGARALRHGTARGRVAGLEAVLADGSVITRMAGLTKDNAGYDLPSLLIGSEGTLAIVTRVLWKLELRQDARVAALVPLESAAAAAALLTALRAEAPSLESCEFFLDAGLRLVLSQLRRSSPLPSPSSVYVLAECASRTDPTDELVAALDRAGIEDALIADDTVSRERLWALREGHADAINAAGVPHKLDVGVPLAALDAFLAAVPAAVAPFGPAVRPILFGHLGDGNVHVNLLGLPADDERADDAVLQLVLDHGGTISAEHGVGVAKARWLERARGTAEVAAMRSLKTALDPRGLLNPGKLLPAPG
ncbi:FAD-binding oxidoreductase [Conexibacter sp. JD483]|uniref:FAD-binding oxidoreductase n=1 Tax=unclassified Conexibacter TaxID=2627773 RepID=UPI00271CDD65|nr:MULTISPECIES: FAD-binding oxidoreductase [unclassified Conexibacter]MDO8185697.1 FAD-binding oxidoreductase [Conexibacter sp. CPCC 205706]MDO8199074.1 FAD-binding oxidoreductase [Conexibacter sp. CPCC 205762]MDR9370507.1 FAD-binding oxidoreductase [Conexibacter sp. JD483]